MGGIDQLKSDLRYLDTDEGKTQDSRLKTLDLRYSVTKWIEPQNCTEGHRKKGY